MSKVRLGVVSMFVLLFWQPVTHAETLVLDSPAPQVMAKPANEPQEITKQKTLTARGWASRCVSQSRQSPLDCSIEESLVLSNTGQLVASVVVRMPPDAHQPIIAIRAPAGLYLPAGLSIQIDEEEPQAVPLQSCDVQGCYAEMQITPKLLAALQNGKRLSIVFQNLAKNKIALPLTLGNFADALQKIQ